MKYTVETTKKFDKSFKLCQRRGYNMGLLLEAVSLLAAEGSLPGKYRPHKLSGFKGAARGSATSGLTGCW